MPVATIKFYLREQLLHPGTPTARNQAEYDQTHLERLRLIRALTGVGMMSLASVREVMAAVDSNCMSPQEVVKAVNRALEAQHPHPPAKDDADSVKTARIYVDDFITGIGWRVDNDAPCRDTLTQILAALQSLGLNPDASTLVPYADAAQRLAAGELKSMPNDPAAAIAARTVLFEAAFAVIRRMAYEHQLALHAQDQSTGQEV